MATPTRKGVLVLTLALVLVGCAGSGDGGGRDGGAGDDIPSEDGLTVTCWPMPKVGGPTAQGAPADPRAAAVAAVAARLEDHGGTARFATSTCVTLPERRGDHQLWVSDGLADFDGDRFRFRQRSVDPGDPTRTCFYEYVVIGDKYWGRGRACSEGGTDRDGWDGPGTLTTDEPRLFTPWIPGVINGRYEAEEDPYRPSVEVRRQIVDALIARVDPAGTEELHGEPTWRYRLTLDRARATRILPPAVSTELAWGKYRSPAYPTLDVWLDAEARLRRVVAVTGLFGQPARIGFELWDVGSAPRVRVPAKLPGR